MEKKRVFQGILSFTENCVAMRKDFLFYYGELEALIKHDVLLAQEWNS
jgi:hypothetical protein